MSMFDRIRGLGRKKKTETSISSEESFDLDDDALFGSDELGGGEALGTMGDLDAKDAGGLDTFGTLGDDQGDLGAAGTQDFEGFDDFGSDDLAGGGGFDDEFGDAAGLGGEEEPAGKKGKKKKKAKRPKAAGRPGRGKVVGVALGLVVVGGAIGFVGTPFVMDTITGERRMRAELADAEAQLQSLRQQLGPLERAASPEEVQQMQVELATRQEHQQTVADIEIKVADRGAREDQRDQALRRRDAAAEALAVRKASLHNVTKRADQIALRVAYLTEANAHLQAATEAHDARVRKLQAELPEAYAASATADARQTLSVQARLEFGASE